MSSRSGQGKDENGVLLLHDAVSNALPAVDELHHRVHLGELQTLSFIKLFVAALGTFRVYLFPPSTYHIRIRGSCSNLGSRRLRFYEKQKFTGDPGDINEVPSYNHNRVIGDGVTDDIFVASDLVLTPSGTGILLYEEIVPQLSDLRTQEWIIKPPLDTEPYMIELANLDSVNAVVATIHLDYYLA